MDSSHSSSFLNINMLGNMSESEDEYRNKSNTTINSDKTSNKTKSPFHQTSNNAIKYFKKLKRKTCIHHTEPKLKNNVVTSPDLVRSLNTKRTLSELKNDFNTKKKKLNSDFIDLNKEFENTFKSSFNYENEPDLEYLKFVIKSEDVCISPKGKKPSPKYESYSSLTSKSLSTVNSSISNKKCNEQFESSISSNSFDSYQMNSIKESLKQKTESILNLTETFGDGGLYHVPIVSKYIDDSLSLFSSSSIDQTRSSCHSVNTESPSSQIEFTPKQPLLESDVSSRNSDDPIPQILSNAISVSDLIEDSNSDQQNQMVGEQICTLNHKHSEVNNLNIFSENVSSNVPNDRLELSVCASIDNVHSEPHVSGRKRTPLKNNDIDTSHISKKQKNLRDKTYHSNSMITNFNELQYRENKDDNNTSLVELPYRALVPSFLSKLKPKNSRKLCACGITISETPEYWSEFFHKTLHQNINKLCFVGELPENDVVHMTHDNLSYRIVMSSANHYNDQNIQKCITNVNDYVCLEYGISKLNNNLLKNSTYLAVLPNSQVIGFLEVEPIQNAFILTDEEQFSDIVPAKYGVSKIWVLIRYKDKNVDINLLETFRKKEKLQKEDLAFTLGACEGVQFIKKYIEKGNVLIYK